MSGMNFNRRDILRGTGLAAAAAFLPALPEGGGVQYPTPAAGIAHPGGRTYRPELKWIGIRV